MTLRDDLYVFFWHHGGKRCSSCGKMKHYCPRTDTFFCINCMPKRTDGIGRTHWEKKG